MQMKLGLIVPYIDVNSRGGLNYPKLILVGAPPPLAKYRNLGFDCSSN